MGGSQFLMGSCHNKGIIIPKQGILKNRPVTIPYVRHASLTVVREGSRMADGIPEMRQSVSGGGSCSSWSEARVDHLTAVLSSYGVILEQGDCVPLMEFFFVVNFGSAFWKSHDGS